MVTINSSWGYNVSTTSDENGNWQTVVKTKKDPGPYSLKVKSGIKSIDIKDILMGEVWLASGQSNMEMTFDGYFYYLSKIYFFELILTI